ncbi:MAG: acireductone synthase [Chromatiales bacterium]|nr:acireductone synthase [Chromatiales bacterium]
MSAPRSIVTDIEGTTTSVRFVYDTLFPYARERIGAFVREHRADPVVAAQIAAIAEQAGGDSLDAAIATLTRWIDEDRKATPLKTLQGLIWAAGYADGTLRGHVYADAATTLRRWHAAGHALYVYSSGSIAAQKLLFGYSDHGDLTPLFSGYFDTTTGPKREADSYRRIAQTIGRPGEEIVFLSDIEAELDAARAAGLHTVWLARDSEPDPRAGHRQVADFTTIDPERP